MACFQDHAKLVRERPEAQFCFSCGEKLERKLDDPDYVTTLACVNPQRAIVAVMHYDKADDSYRVKKCSEPLSQKAAIALADSWAAALHLEVR